MNNLQFNMSCDYSKHDSKFKPSKLPVEQNDMVFSHQRIPHGLTELASFWRKMRQQATTLFNIV